MYKFIISSVIIGFFINAQAASITAGEEKSVICASCHGVNGNSVTPTFPKLAGQNASYITKQLNNFKSGNRQDVLMSGQAAPLSQEDISDLALYYESKNIETGVADKDLVTLGQKIYQNGAKSNEVSACIACHGPKGNGNKPSKYPKLSGQHAGYIESQLNKFKSNIRTNDPNGMMHDISRRMTDKQIKAVSSYIQGLY